MQIRESLQNLINVHPNSSIDLTHNYFSRVELLTEKVRETFRELNQEMCITPDIQDFNVDAKDPIQILNLIVKMFVLCNANIKENGLNSFDKLVEKLVKQIHTEDNQKCRQDSARLSIENFDLKKKSVKLQYDIEIVREKLMASEEAYSNVVRKAEDTVSRLKGEFSQVLGILRLNQQEMLKLQINNKGLLREKTDLQVSIKDYKQNTKHKRDPDVLRERREKVMAFKQSEKAEQMQRQDKMRATWNQTKCSRK